ncbi:MAG: hypothetical protein ABIQ95_05505 [Bdellovibrionia bacterium]
MAESELKMVFLAWVGICISGVVVALFLKLPKTTALKVTAMIMTWLIYSGYLAQSGFLAEYTAFPPRFIFILLPMVVFLLYLTKSSVIKKVAVSCSPALFILPQVFRIPVELLLYQLYRASLVPKMLTYEGRNIDLLVALTAPIAALLIYKYPGKKDKLIKIWNLSGILILSNVVFRGILSAPSPLRILNTEPPNLAIGIFPYVYLPAVFVLLAFSLHILSLRTIERKV